MSSLSAAVRFAGYAALFDRPDSIRDTIARGAFINTLKHRKRPLPLYWQHSPDQQIGLVEQAREDARGLAVIGHIDNPYSRVAHDLIKLRVHGLSFGYRARRYKRTDEGRNLLEIELIEVSLVTEPLHPEARVHLVV
ncbi:hypothetical protein BPTFM16_01949 [Altererythrobacter insulae]|nr:hypothetical protein BPTFM16_01949 [Altererythrobacter insulae]